MFAAPRLKVWHLPIKAAAAQLDVGVSSLKKICRDHHIGRWPYRKLQCLARIQRQISAWGGCDTSGLTQERVLTIFFDKLMFQDGGCELLSALCEEC